MTLFRPLLLLTLITLTTSAFSLSEEILFKRLDPLSISEQLSFYHLYPDTPYGKQALKRAWDLLQGQPSSTNPNALSLPPFDLQKIITLITRQSIDPPEKLSQDDLELIEHLGSSLCNRKLIGRRVWSKSALDALPVSHIDLGRGLLINQFEDAPDKDDQIRQYEALLDLMALQIRARLTKNASNQEKVQAINTFIFHEMNYRFPPHSLYAKNIDHYTFLPSVMDNRQGVCLGVSVLYLCLAQRLDLPLEIVTPPGHIYVRLHEGETITNIEPTACGIDVPSESYLGVNTRHLPLSTIREVMGMVFYNHGSLLAWDMCDFKQAAIVYEKALNYMQNDAQVKMLLGLSYLLSGKKSEGKALLKSASPLLFDEVVSPETIAEDYLAGNVSLKGIKAAFTHVNNQRESILKKQKKLQKILRDYPRFRDGWFQLAITYLQLGREGEAFDTLKKFDSLEKNNVNAAYYLSILALERMDYNTAWTYLKQAEKLAADRNHHPKALHSLKQHLKRLSPDPHPSKDFQ